LIEKVIQIDAHNVQLKAILLKTLGEESGEKQHQKKFDFSKCHTRHVLLKFLYLGWDYQGYAVQEESNTTIEYHLFKALTKTCLIEKRENSNYHRCGRTDKGVSAFEQTVSIDLRSLFPDEEQLSEENMAKELNYCHMLNRNLPRDIRCVAWMPVKCPTYSARFDCKERLYRYFFPRGDLNIEAMREACRTLIGQHDFRNLCKMDVGNGVVNFIRNIYNAQIRMVEKEEGASAASDYDMFFIEIHGRSFLWHQIRCVMTIMLLIGEEKESPDILKQLFDVDRNPCKPQYHLASEIPLNLYWVNYAKKSANFYEKANNDPNDVDEDDMVIEDVTSDEESDLTKWVYDKKDLGNVIRDLQGHWTENSVK
jgi:tRNA pseudouridine38/39 synthase